VARLLHSLQAPDPAVQFDLLQIAQQQLYLGGMRRLRHTLPALGFAILHLVRRIAAGEEAKGGKGGCLVVFTVQLPFLASLCVAAPDTHVGASGEGGDKRAGNTFSYLIGRGVCMCVCRISHS